MNAAFIYGPYDIRVKQVPSPKIGSGEVLVAMKACGVCGTDIEKMEGRFITPPALGHEVTGEVLEVGNKVNDIRVGDRVFVHHHVPCYRCHYCRRGDYTMCADFPATNLDPCGMAEYFRVPEQNVQRGAVLKLPDNVGFEIGTLIEPTACCIRGLSKTRLTTGDDVLILGAGPIGLTMVSLLKLRSVHKIIVSEIISRRKKAAEDFGADYVFDPFEQDLRSKVFETTEGRGADLVIVAVGSSKAIAQGLECVRKGGQVMLFGLPPRGDTLSFDVSRLFINEVALTSSYSTTEIETMAALKLIESDRLDLQRLITHTFPLSRAPEAIKFAAECKDALKVVVKP